MENILLAAQIGENVARYRTMAGLTLAELASRTMVSPPFLSKVEHGEKIPGLPLLMSIADALKVSCDALIYPPSAHTHMQNILTLLNDQPPTALHGLERILRVCCEDLESE